MPSFDDNQSKFDADSDGNPVNPPNLIELVEIKDDSQDQGQISSQLDDTLNKKSPIKPSDQNNVSPQSSLNKSLTDQDSEKSLLAHSVQSSKKQEEKLIQDRLESRRSEDKKNTDKLSDQTNILDKSSHHFESSHAVSNLDHQANSKSKNKIFFSIIKIILFIIGGFVFVYMFLNFPALIKRFQFSYEKQTGKIPEVLKIIPPATNQDLLFLSTVSMYETPSQELEKPKYPTKKDLGLEDLTNNEIVIPKIDVRAPMIWDSPVDEATMMENLKHGVVHYKGAAKPGEKSEDGEGNVFISGHSSYYWWDDGKYKTVFVNLDQMNIGDEVGVGYDDYIYIYKVFEKIIVSPDEVSVINQDTDKHIMSIMTCWPIGTDSKRLIVKAELIAKGTDLPQELHDDIMIKDELPAQDTSTEDQDSYLRPDIILPKSHDPNIIDILPWYW
jgi:sortase A